MSDDELRFGFGRNWERYLEERFSEERVQISKEHLLRFLQLPDLQGKYFLDVGCGSGLHSLAALRAGAAKVVSFDPDPHSVLATRMLRNYAGDPQNWTVMEGSILDVPFIETIEPADIVLAWGVLHHTGNMWQAVENTRHLMKREGSLYIAIYVDEPYFGLPMSYWLNVKKRYNQVGWLAAKRMEWWHILRFYLLPNLAHIPNLVRWVRDYKKNRGMDLYRDAVDWLGGWPFEYASVEEVTSFVADRLGLELGNVATGQACAEYLFQHPQKPAGDRPMSFGTQWHTPPGEKR